MKEALAKLNAKVIHVQLAEDLLEDIIMSFNSSHEDEDIVNVGSNSIESLQSLLGAMLETGTGVCQSEGHALVLTEPEWHHCSHE